MFSMNRVGKRRQLAIRIVKEAVNLPKGANMVIVSGTEEEAQALLAEVKNVSKEIGLESVGDFNWQLKAIKKDQSTI